ncbi:MAG: aldo/keto reductase [Clostridiaceae bacterium]|nr:aldo/keto reductase [Clostridiaceae bacterium]
MKKLGFGMMRLPLRDSKDQTAIDYEQVCQMVDTFLEQGFTYVDTAYMYHDYASEGMVKRALVERHPRDSFLLATKLPTMMLKTKEDQARIFKEQLEKCGVEYFDYYLLHCLNQENYANSEKLGSFDFVLQKKKEGKIKKVGFSFHDTAELLDEILTKHPEMEFVQIQLNYLDWESSSVQSRLCYEVCVKHNKPVIVMEPVKGGTLAKVPAEAEKLMKEYHPDASVASWAVRFAASQKNVFMVLSGMSDLQQLRDNTSYMRDFEPLNEEEQKIIEAVKEQIHSFITVPCTGCKYCVEGCPKKIPIPQYFSLYNAHRQLRENDTTKEDYRKLENCGRANECIACRQCEEHCPQHLTIVDYLKEVSSVFDES